MDGDNESWWAWKPPEEAALWLLDGWRKLTAHPGGMDIPHAPPSLAVTGKLLADEAYLLGRSHFGPAAAKDLDVIGCERDVHAMLEIHSRSGAFESPDELHIEPPDAEPRLTSEWSAVGRYEHLRFESGYEPSLEVPGRRSWLQHRDNREAHAWTLRNKGDATRWLICIPGWGMGNPTLDLTAFSARELHEATGLNIAVYVPPLHGPRSRSWRSGTGLFEASPIAFVHAASQAVWDLRRLSGWIRANGGQRIGTFGVSLGATFASLFANVDPGLACVVAGMPELDIVERFAPYCESVAAESGEDVERVRSRVAGLLRLVSPLAAEPLVPLTRRYMFAGIVDRVAKPETAMEFWKHWGKPNMAWYPGGHVSYTTEPKVRSLLDRAFHEAGLDRAPPKARPCAASPFA